MVIMCMVKSFSFMNCRFIGNNRLERPFPEELGDLVHLKELYEHYPWTPTSVPNMGFQGAESHFKSAIIF